MDPAGKPGVDAVALSPYTLHLFIIGCTTGVIQTDLEEMEATLNDMKREIGDLLKKYKVVPVIITAKDATIPPEKTEYARERGIIILTNEDVDKLISMSKTRRSSKEVTQYIENKLHS